MAVPRQCSHHGSALVYSFREGSINFWSAQVDELLGQMATRH